jgi:hypothetical protein
MAVRLRAKREVWRRLAYVVNGAPQETEWFFADLRERRLRRDALTNSGIRAVRSHGAG